MGNKRKKDEKIYAKFRSFISRAKNKKREILDGEIHGVEFSIYSWKEGMYPFHISDLGDLVEQHLDWMSEDLDPRLENRKNIWETIFTGTVEECSDFVNECNKILGIQ